MSVSLLVERVIVVVFVYNFFLLYLKCQELNYKNYELEEEEEKKKTTVKKIIFIG